MTSRIGDEIVRGLEEFTETLERGEKVSGKFTVRTVVLDLKPKSYSPEDVKETRAMLGVSQAVFAQFLGVSASCVRAWEQGVNRVTGSAARLMDEIRHDPKRWQRRLRELAVQKSRT